MARIVDGRPVGKITHPIFGRISLTKNGQIRSAVHEPRKNTTLEQYVRQIRVRHAAAMWNVLKPLIRDNFGVSSPYTIIAPEASNSPALFGITKVEKETNNFPVAPILVSYGDILPITYDHATQATNIRLGSLQLDIDSIYYTTYNDLVDAILNNDENLGYQYGDTITLLYVFMKADAETEYIELKPGSLHLVLEHRPGLLLDTLPLADIYLRSVEIAPGEYALTFDPFYRNCGFAFIHQGKRDGADVYSTQHLICRTDPWQLNRHKLKAEFLSISGNKEPSIITASEKLYSRCFC